MTQGKRRTPVPEAQEARTQKRNKRQPCEGGCGRQVFTAFCDQCAPPTPWSKGKPQPVTYPKVVNPDEGYI